MGYLIILHISRRRNFQVIQEKIQKSFKLIFFQIRTKILNKTIFSNKKNRNFSLVKKTKSSLLLCCLDKVLTRVMDSYTTRKSNWKELFRF